MTDDDLDEVARARVGRVLNDKWTLVRLIGMGGMAAVYAGEHRNGARAAIKVLHPHIARRPEIRDRFLREGYAANRVRHAGVVKVLDDDTITSGPDEGTAFLVMELLLGESIEDRLERGPPIVEGELMPILRAVLEVLEVAHAAGVIHRDLKPENLFLARDPEHKEAPPRLKVLDFGLARVAQGGAQRTMSGLAIGTPSYMPPEQAAGRVQEIDARSDLFALGATCFRILAGRTVHPADGPMEICVRMAKEPAPKLRSVAPHVSEMSAAAIDRALEFRREDRWPNAAAMRSAVEIAIASLGGNIIEITSGVLDVDGATQELRLEPASIAAESPLAPPPSAPATPAPSPEPSRSISDPPPPKKKRSWLPSFLILILAGVAGKLIWDDLQTSPARVEDAAPAPVDAEAKNASLDAAVDVSIDQSVDHAADVQTDATLDASEDAPADAATDASLEKDSAPDAHSAPQHDAGRHIPPIHTGVHRLHHPHG